MLRHAQHERAYKHSTLYERRKLCKKLKVKNMKNLFKKITNFIKENNLIMPNSTIIIGLSGGPDSVFLLHYLLEISKENNLTVIAAHLNHGWRTESEQDTQFCKALCAQYNITFISKKISELDITIKCNGSKEEIGRRARRYLFESLALQHNAAAIAVAHHADDQMETFFIRLIRGASLAGLVGMKPKDGLYIRPLLQTKKEEILQYLHSEKINYQIDASNGSADYLRNRIRNTVIPALQLVDDRFEQNFQNTHAQLHDAEKFLQNYAAQKMTEITINNTLAIDALLALDPIIRKRVLINWLIANKAPFSPSQGLLDEMVRFLESPGNSQHTFYEKWCIKKVDGKAEIASLF